METHASPPTPPSVTLPVALVADLQDSLLIAMTDLQRLEGLLDHATGNLLERFGNANRDRKPWRALWARSSPAFATACTRR